MNNKSRFEFTTRRPVAIFMIVVGIALFGLVSYSQLSWDLMPEISYPSFTVRTEYPGAAPEEVENVVSRPLEEQLSLIKDLVSITSISRPEQSDIVLEFTWDANLDRSAQEIREKLDQVFLDPAVEKPMILRYDPSLDPLLRIGVTSEIPLIDLRVLVEDEIARELEALPGVAAARVKGGFEKEILVKLDEKQLAAFKIRFSEVTTRLAQENINLAGGNIKEGDTEYIVRTLNEFRNVKEIGDIIIAKRENVLVRLKDIAEVSYSHKERKVITRVNQGESIEVNIFKEADANIVEVSNRVKDRLFGTPEQQTFVKMLTARKSENKGEGNRTEANIIREKQMTNFLQYQLSNQGHDIQYHILSDQAIFIENSINEVKSTAFIGGILAIIILYLFLRHFSTTLIVAVSIPLSVIATFAPLKFFQVSLNIMSLGGLALGIGMLVDNSIVVMESIFRCREEGDGWVDSAVRGVSEVGTAVIASTLTTIAVFFPIVFVEGIAGQIFGDLSLAVVFSLLASLMVSLFFIPMLASRKFKKTTDFSLRKFAFEFEKEHTIGNYLFIPIEIIKNVFILLFNLVLVFLLLFVSVVIVLLYPVLAILGIHKKPVESMKRFTGEMFFHEMTLWEDFMTITPLDSYAESMSHHRLFILWPFAWFYYIFRFFLSFFSFAFVRFSLSLLGMVIIFLKGLGLMLLSIAAPVVKFLTFLFNKLLKAINTFYPRLLEISLKKATQVIVVVLVIFAFTILVVLPRVGSELIPEVHQGTLYVNVTFPVGTPVERSDELLQKISRKIRQIQLVNSISFYAGTTEDELQEKEVGEHIGKITVMLKKTRDIQASEEMIIANIRSLLKDFTDLDYNISRPVLFTMKPPIEVVIKGYNLEQLRRISAELYERIAAIPGLRDVQTSIKTGFPELVVEFNRMRLSHYGMNAFDVASLIKNKIEGFVATKFKEQDKRVDIRVYLKDEQRRRAENIKNLIINPGGAIPIPLSSVAAVNILSGPNEIRRVDQDRSAIISANISHINLTSAVRSIYNVIERYPMPPGFSYELSGQNKEMETSLNSLTLAMVLAIFLVYIVMASQFESFLHPFLILFTIPMALIGVFLTLYVLNIPIGITVYIGMITLVGIVVNNAIILIDYINKLRKRGYKKLEAIKQAGHVRLRPILITTSTTVLALLPMALGLGEGAEIRIPMAVTIIAGLLSSTFLTLVLIPIVYNKFSK
ncbi:MAG: efflux RND transporter permease subunit [Candidatus Aminicenantes bacterium]|nr:MAG: efflux RND transporter permease subunit [Candidatus Aminicenantes bacterium]